MYHAIRWVWIVPTAAIKNTPPPLPTVQLTTADTVANKKFSQERAFARTLHSYGNTGLAYLKSVQIETIKRRHSDQCGKPTIHPKQKTPHHSSSPSIYRSSSTVGGAASFTNTEEADGVVGAGVPCGARPDPVYATAAPGRRSWARQGSAAGYDGRERPLALATAAPPKPSPGCCPGQTTNCGENRGS